MASISVREWGSIGTEQVMRIDLSQPNGMSVSCINYGARLIRLLVPDREGQSENVVLGLADAEAYGNDQASFGATVGPVAGRIAEGKWGAVQLEQNAGEHHIHGGSRGWGQQFWGFTTEETAEAVSVTFYVGIDSGNGRLSRPAAGENQLYAGCGRLLDNHNDRRLL
ncbi:MAG: hypothetical protein V9E84_09830 [Trichococcus flocculiformis]